MLDAQTRLKNARARLMVKAPFFATLMLSMPMHLTRDHGPTMATNMKDIYVNPDFVDTIDDDVLLFGIAHEVMHVALEHGLRRGARDPAKFNIAADHAINLTLKDTVDREGRTVFKVWEHAYCDDRYREPPDNANKRWAMSADKIYNLLPDDPSGGGDGGGMLGDLLEPEEMQDPAKAETLRQHIQEKVAQAAQVARMIGALDGALERFVSEILEPKVPWFDTLRHLMTEFDASDEDWSRRNRRFADIYLPSDNSECRMGEFIAIGDTSGSISEDDMAAYMAEFLAVAEDCKPERMRIVWGDTRVKSEQVFERGDVIEPAPRGGGGTDMRVMLDFVAQYDPKIVVLFTDAETPWPDEEPDYPLIVCATTGAAVPIGEVIRL